MPSTESRDVAVTNRLRNLRPFLRKLTVGGIGVSIFCVGLGVIDIVLGAMSFPPLGPQGTGVGLLLIGFGLIATSIFGIALDSLEDT